MDPEDIGKAIQDSKNGRVRWRRRRGREIDSVKRGNRRVGFTCENAKTMKSLMID